MQCRFTRHGSFDISTRAPLWLRQSGVVPMANPKTRNRFVVRCFMCGKEMLRTDTPDKTPPYRCHDCFAAVAANEADGEL
jgi:hypothetical protein